MFGLPYKKITIHTDLDREKVSDNLWGIVGPGKDFKGKLTERGFQIRCATYSWGRDPYRPVIRGTIISLSKGNEVTLSFWPRLTEVFQIVAIFSFAEFLAISKDISMWWWPIAAFTVLHVGLYVFSFVPGQRWAESRLRSVLAS